MHTFREHVGGEPMDSPVVSVSYSLTIDAEYVFCLLKYYHYL